MIRRTVEASRPLDVAGGERDARDPVQAVRDATAVAELRERPEPGREVGGRLPLVPFPAGDLASDLQSARMVERALLEARERCADVRSRRPEIAGAEAELARSTRATRAPPPAAALRSA